MASIKALWWKYILSAIYLRPPVFRESKSNLLFIIIKTNINITINININIIYQKKIYINSFVYNKQKIDSIVIKWYYIILEFYNKFK